MTPDKDFAQLVTDKIFMYRPGQRGNKHQIWDVATVCEKFDINNVRQVVDFLGMVGDSVDNIPGIAGVGPKTASKLLKEYGSLERVYESVDNLDGKLKEKIMSSKSNAFLSKQLATIILNVPIQLDPDTLIVTEPNWQKLNVLFKELEFRRIYDRIRKIFNHKSQELSIDSQFVGCVEEEVSIGNFKGIIPSIEGNARIIGYNKLIFHPSDPYLSGFQVI